MMRVLILGGVAAGTKVAAKLKRLRFDAEVLILTKDADISYAGCGLPYYVGDVITDREKIIVNTPENSRPSQGQRFDRQRSGETGCGRKTVTAKNLATAKKKFILMSACVISTGASSYRSTFAGGQSEGVFTMRTP